jgi:NADH-quinone oxidoreductase subunit E
MNIRKSRRSINKDAQLNLNVSIQERIMQTQQSDNLARKFTKVCDILEQFKYDRTKLIKILHLVQEEYRYLPEEILTYIATALGIPPAEVYGVATFYAHFALEPKGKYVIKLCNGTACHVKGSMPIYHAIKDYLQLPEDKETTDDLMFTIELVSCLGACGLAPVMVINEDVHGQVTPEKVRELLAGIIAGEEHIEQ